MEVVDGATAATGAADHQVLRDPITLEAFEDICAPVVASDGYTYALAELQTAVAADPWHRSPVTGEVLRPHVVPNLAAPFYQGVSAGVIADAVAAAAEVQLYSRVVPSHGHHALAAAAHVMTWRLPRHLTARDEIVCHAWGVSAGASLTVVLQRQPDGVTHMLMHPPIVAEGVADAVELARVFGLAPPFVKNPWCLADAVLQQPSHSHDATTSTNALQVRSARSCDVETQWLDMQAVAFRR